MAKNLWSGTWVRATLSLLGIRIGRPSLLQRLGGDEKHEGRACASSPRHVLSCCYRDWDQDQISLVRNW